MHPTAEYILKRFNVKPVENPIRIDGSRYVELPKLFWKLGFRSGAEIGVCTGRYSKVLCRYNPKMKLYCIDPWEDYDEYMERYLQGESNFPVNVARDYEEARSRLAPYNCTLIKDYSVQAAELFPDNSLDFVYVDGNHSFRYVVDDIAVWSRKVRPGGIISGHDYYNTREDVRGRWGTMPKDKLKLLCQVKDAVDAWAKTNEINPWFLLTKERSPTWFWAKE